MSHELEIKEISYKIIDIKRNMDVAPTKQDAYLLSKSMKEEMRKLKIVLEAHFEYERQNNIPPSFQYRAMHRKIKKITL